MVKLIEAINLFTSKCLVESDLLNERSVKAYHVGSELRGGKFDVSYAGSGEGKRALGPGIYFATNKDIALRYKKYSQKPWLYEVEIKTRGLYDPVYGEPKRLRENIEGLAEELKKDRDLSKLPTGSRFNDGAGVIGSLVYVLGAREARARMVRAGIMGAFEKLPNDVYEISIYDTSEINILNSSKLFDESLTADPGIVEEFTIQTPSRKSGKIRRFYDVVRFWLENVDNFDKSSIHFYDGDGNEIGDMVLAVESSGDEILLDNLRKIMDDPFDGDEFDTVSDAMMSSIAREGALGSKSFDIMVRRNDEDVGEILGGVITDVNISGVNNLEGAAEFIGDLASREI